MATLTSPADNASTPEASRQVEGLFRNHAQVKREGFRKTLRIMWNMIFHKPRDTCLLYTSPSPRDRTRSRMPSSA